MEVLSLYWRGGGKDMHLMRGSSGPLDLTDWLWVTSKATPTSSEQTQDLATFLSSNPNAVATFKPTFKAALDAATNNYAGFGVKINARNGLVTAGPNPGPQPLYNFTVMATIVADKNDPASPRKRVYLRIHLHNYVAKAWFSPAHLKVPKNITGFMFSIYIQFDDKTIAEPDIMNLTWTSDPPDKVTDFGYVGFDDTDADGAHVRVVALLPDEFKDENGAVVFAEGIAIPYSLPKVAQLIAGSAGYERRDQVPNFIFLAEGFQGGDEPKFNSMIDNFLTALRQKDNFKPFDHLLERMNFWKVFVPSVARGIGTRYEVYGDARTYPVPTCSETFDVLNDSPTSQSDLIDHAWGPNQLRHYFGLPVITHKNMPNADIKAYWKQISYLPAGLIDEVPEEPNGLITEWKKMADRRVVDQSDTFIGVQNGGPTKAKALSGEDLREYQTNYSRFTRSRLNKFLTDLQYQDENGALHPLGAVWDIEPPASGGSDPAGKDYDNVIVLLCANYGRELNQNGILFASVIDKGRDYLGIEPDPAATPGFADSRAVKMADLEPGRLLDDMPLIPGKSTLLHEIGHSLGLGDEYGESGISKQSIYFQFTGTADIATDKHYSNVEVRSDLVHGPPSGSIDAESIKWRWLRIEKSAVLAPLAGTGPAAISTNGAQYTIKVRPGQAAAFAEFDVVLLRRRKPGESILRDVEYSQISTRYPFVTRSPQLAVISVDPAADQVVVQPVNPADLTGHDLIADFPADCVLYKPLLSRTDNPTDFGYPFLELVAANVMRYMATTGQPLHEKMDDDGNPQLDFDAEQNPVLVDIGNPLCAKKNRNIIGLYAGGNQYHHGVYHPTGHCIMRDNYQVAEFCVACKYIITEYIDPSLHPETDKLIEPYYPLKDEPPDPAPPF